MNWKTDQSTREIAVLRRYLIQKREDYTHYNRMVGMVLKLSHRLQKLDKDDPIRIQTTQLLLDKLYELYQFQILSTAQQNTHSHLHLFHYLAQ